MGIFDWIRKRSYENYKPFSQSYFITDNAGEIVNGMTSMSCPPYASAVNLISTSLGKLSRHVMKDGERVEKHFTEKLMQNPNPWIDGYTLFQQAEMHRLNDGNAYIEIIRNDKGMAKELFLINPSFVSILLENGGYVYQVNRNGKTFKVDPKNMIHVKSPFLDTNTLKGLGYHTVLSRQIGLWLAGQGHQARYFALGSNPTSILETSEKLSKDSKTAVREAWEELNGKGNKHRVAVLDGGFTYKSMGFNFDELQMTEMYDNLTKQIASVFNIAPYLLGHDGSKNTYSNVESQNMQFLQQALMPGIIAWEQQLQKLFNPSSSFYIKFNYETLLRADSTNRATRLKTLVEANIMTSDEARQYEGLSPKGGDSIGD